MMGKYQKEKNLFIKNKINRNAYNPVKSYDIQTIYENNRKFKKLILKLRNKLKYNLLTFFNSKK